MPRDCRVPEAQLRRRLAQGWSYRGIGREFGWAETTIRERCQKLGLPKSRPDHHPNAAVPTSEFRRDLIETTLSLAKLADAWGITHAAVWKRARALGLPTDQTGRAQLRAEAA